MLTDNLIRGVKIVETGKISILAEKTPVQAKKSIDGVRRGIDGSSPDVSSLYEVMRRK